MTTSPDTSTAPDRQIELERLFADFDQELAITRRVLERYPEEHADWRPHEKSMSLVELAAHLASLPRLGEIAALSPELDFASMPYVPPTARTRSEILELFDKQSATTRAAVSSLDADGMRATWTLRAGDKVYASGPRANHLRTLMLSHMIHHRGQLTVYYRLLGVPVPSVYGPSADESV